MAQTNISFPVLFFVPLQCKQIVASGAQLQTIIKAKNMDNIRLITDEQLNAFASQVASRVAINTKDVLTSDEAAVYLGVSKSFLI